MYGTYKFSEIFKPNLKTFLKKFHYITETFLWTKDYNYFERYFTSMALTNKIFFKPVKST